MNVPDSKTKCTINESFCNTCLSLDRKLSELGDLAEIFSKICDIFEEQNQKMMICWECKAILGKVKKFRQKALSAQMILSYEYPPSLSLSTISTKIIEDDSKDYVPFLQKEEQSLPEQVEIKLEHNANEAKLLIGLTKADTETLKIKEEDTDEEDINDDNVNAESDALQELQIALDIKHEVSSKNEKNKIRATESARDSFKYISDEKEKKANIMKIKISPNEVDEWMKKDKESDYFKDTNCKWRCESCIIAYLSQALFKKHCRSHHSRKNTSTQIPYKQCDICLQTIPIKQWDSHNEEHYQIYMCECGYQCYTWQHMSWHKKNVHNSKQVQCLKCENIFLSLKEFFAHFREIHRSYICHHCGKRFLTKNSITRHMKWHVFPTECKECNAKFTTYKSYFKHQRLKHMVCPDENTYCVLCDKMFDNRAQFRNHVAYSAAHRHEQKPKKPRKKAVCPVCKREFYKNYNMKVHFEHEHLKITKFYCAECHRYFKAKKTLEAHHRSVHLGLTPVKDKLCTICGRSFSSKVILVHHMRTHTGERPHECQFCDAKFAQKYAMQTHVKHVHLNVKRKAGWQKTDMTGMS